MANLDITIDCPTTTISLGTGANCSIACDSPFVNNYYSPCVTCTGTLEIGCTIYFADTGAVAPTGYYSDGTYCYFQSGGSIASKTACSPPTPQGPYTFEIFGSIFNTFFSQPVNLGTLICSFQRYNSAGTLISSDTRNILYTETNGRPINQGGPTTKSIISYSNIYSGDYIDVAVTQDAGGGVTNYVKTEVGSHPVWGLVSFGFFKRLGYYNNLTPKKASDSHRYRLVVGKHEVVPPNNYISANILGHSYPKFSCTQPFAFFVGSASDPRPVLYVYKVAEPYITSIVENLNSWTVNITTVSTGSNNFVSEVGVCFGNCLVPERTSIYKPYTTSTSTVTMGTGTKTFIVSPSNVDYRYGDPLSFSAIGQDSYMYGNVVSYDSGTGTLIMNITSIRGAGTFSNWSIAPNYVDSFDTIRYTGSIPAPSSGQTQFSYSMTVPKSVSPYDEVTFRPYTIDAYGLAYGEPANLTTVTGPPAIQTMGVSDVFANSAVLSGALINANNGTVTAKGFQYSTGNPIPTNAPTVPSNNAAATLGEYTGDLVGLTDNRLYYYRAYATNQYGTSYGDTAQFQTAGAGEVYYLADTYFCPDCLTSAGTTIIRFSSTPFFAGYGVLGGAYYQLLSQTTGPNFDVDGDFLTQVSNCNVACSG